MINIKDHKEKIYPILVFGIILIVMYFINRYENSKPKISIYGKVISYEIAANIKSYYIYKFQYEGKFYKSTKLTSELNKKIIGRCFVVYIDPNDPDNSDLDLSREVNCENFLISPQR